MALHFLNKYGLMAVRLTRYFNHDKLHLYVSDVGTFSGYNTYLYDLGNILLPANC
jgi:hypothetical protein